MDTKELEELRQKDQLLVGGLFEKNSQLQTTPLIGFEFRNSMVAEALKESASPSQLFHLLHRKGCFDLNTEKHPWVDTDAEECELTLNRASKTQMWPMGTHFWVRDNALIAAKLLHLDYDGFCYPLEWFQLGKDMLLSSLTIMSSNSQLERFERIIKNPNKSLDAHQWPHIFLTISDNLNAVKTEPWMHKQDAWQILCYQVLDALEHGLIQPEDLTEKHVKLLQLIAPFLKAIDFSHASNGGSWEEVEAVRSSVIAWELALLAKLKSSHLELDDSVIDALVESGISKLAQNLPFEAPERNDASYREADAALIYLLQLKTYDLLPETKANETRLAIIEQIGKLLSTHGCRRYLGDSYQGQSYYRNETIAKLEQITNSPSGDSSGLDAFSQRASSVPAGHEAEWTHFDWQLSSYYGKRYQELGDEEDRVKQLHYYHFGLSLITGEGEHAIQQNLAGELELIELPAYRLPECYNTEIHDGTTFKYPSLHTPLYWSVAECIAAFDQVFKLGVLES